MYVGDWLGRREMLTPERLALVDDSTGQRYTYRQLNQRANRLAYALRQHWRIRQGQRVAVVARNRIEYLDLLFAVGKLGAILVPLNWRLTPSELAFQLKDSQPSLLLHDTAATEQIAALQPLLSLPTTINFDTADYATPIEHAASAPITSDITADDPFLILYTSGTTGRPKGAILSHRVLIWNALNTIVSWELQAGDVSIIHTPLFHTGGINVLTIPLIHLGGTLVLMREWNTERCWELIHTERVTVFFAVPTMFHMLLEAPNLPQIDHSSVRFFISGGAPCPVHLIQAYQQYNIPFRQGYGLTEVSVNCFSLGPEDAIRKVGSVGKPIFHIDAQIVDEQGAPVSPNVIGELALRGPTVCDGYWKNSIATAQSIRQGWFYTGDLAQMDDEGYFYIVDRKKDMYISGGENVYPTEVEHLLYSHPAVNECAVIGIPHPHWGEVGRAIVVLDSKVTVSAEELQAFCRTHLARYKVPQSFLFVSELPHNSSGKILKPELRRLYGDSITEPSQ